jgi:hypothetical protein
MLTSLESQKIFAEAIGSRAAQKMSKAVPPKIWRLFPYFRHFDVLLRGNDHSPWDSRSSMRCHRQISVCDSWRAIGPFVSPVRLWFSRLLRLKGGKRAAERESVVETYTSAIVTRDVHPFAILCNTYWAFCHSQDMCRTISGRLRVLIGQIRPTITCFHRVL